jgi:hypothetical protein
MPVITKKKRQRKDYKEGTPGGWVCTRSGSSGTAKMPCTFKPPAKAKNFVFYIGNNLVPFFSSGQIGDMTFVPAVSPQYEAIESEICYEDDGTGVGYSTPDEEIEDAVISGNYKKEDYTYGTRCTKRTEYKRIDDGCGGVQSLYKYLTTYKEGKPAMSGTFCVEGDMVVDEYTGKFQETSEPLVRIIY